MSTINTTLDDDSICDICLALKQEILLLKKEILSKNDVIYKLLKEKEIRIQSGK